MTDLRKLHDELLKIQDQTHLLADPELAMGEKTREILAALIEEVEQLRHDVDGLIDPTARPSESGEGPVKKWLGEEQEQVPPPSQPQSTPDRQERGRKHST